MWQRAEEGQANSDFRQVLMECEDYAPHVDKVMKNVCSDGCVMWYWSGQGFRLSLCYRVTGKDCFIMVGVPSPEGTPKQWCSAMISKLRKEMDELGIEHWRAKQQDEYVSEHMADFADGIDRYCHEVEGDEVRNGNRELVFRRRPNKRKMDRRFEGPGKDREPRRRKRQR